MSPGVLGARLVTTDPLFVRGLGLHGGRGSGKGLGRGYWATIKENQSSCYSNTHTEYIQVVSNTHKVHTETTSHHSNV